jgi:hypothetical protein
MEKYLKDAAEKVPCDRETIIKYFSDFKEVRDELQTCLANVAERKKKGLISEVIADITSRLHDSPCPATGGRHAWLYTQYGPEPHPNTDPGYYTCAACKQTYSE